MRNTARRDGTGGRRATALTAVIVGLAAAALACPAPARPQSAPAAAEAVRERPVLATPLARPSLRAVRLPAARVGVARPRPGAVVHADGIARPTELPRASVSVAVPGAVATVRAEYYARPRLAVVGFEARVATGIGPTLALRVRTRNRLWGGSLPLQYRGRQREIQVGISIPVGIF